MVQAISKEEFLSFKIAEQGDVHAFVDDRYWCKAADGEFVGVVGEANESAPKYYCVFAILRKNNDGKFVPLGANSFSTLEQAKQGLEKCMLKLIEISPDATPQN